MIDEKKIEEVANKYAIDTYAFTGPVPIGYKEGIQEIFQTSINWFKENLWHDASEEPKRNEGRAIILVELHLRGNITYTSFNLHNELSRYKVHLNEKNVARWLYIEDLMKGRK